MKKTLTAILLLLSTQAMADCFVVPSPGEGPEINLRASPNGKVIGQLLPHTYVRVQETQPPWLFVSVWTPSGFVPSGWIWGRREGVDPACLPPPEEPYPPLKRDIPPPPEEPYPPLKRDITPPPPPKEKPRKHVEEPPFDEKPEAPMPEAPAAPLTPEEKGWTDR